MNCRRFIARTFLGFTGIGLTLGAASAQTAADSRTPVKVVAAPKPFKEAFPTPLLQAIAVKDIAAVRNILARRANPINAANGEDYNKIPILLACVVGDVSIIKVLLEGGADLNARARFGTTALTLAALKGDAKVVELLIARGADVNARSDIGATALMTAARDGFTDIVRDLIAAGADVNASTDKGFTPLMAAADNAELLGLLLKAGAKPDAIDASGRTAACLAQQNNQARKLALLQQNEWSLHVPCPASH